MISIYVCIGIIFPSRMISYDTNLSSPFLNSTNIGRVSARPIDLVSFICFPIARRSFEVRCFFNHPIDIGRRVDI